MHDQDEQLGMILTQLGYLCDRLAVELPNVDPDFSREVNAIGRARILAHLIDEYLVGHVCCDPYIVGTHPSA